MENKQKINPLRLVIFLLLMAGTIVSVVLSDYIFGEEAVFNQAVAESQLLNTLFGKIPALIQTVQIIAIAWLVAIVVRFVLRKALSGNPRHVTIVKMINSFLKYIIAIVAILLVLGAWGVDTGALIASAGILGLVVGLGAQSLIADIIAGIFIVFEGVYQVGDYVVVDGWRGRVDEIGIRTTKIIDVGGNVKVVNNSAITSIVNQTKELSLARSVISIEYSESIPKVELVIQQNLDKIKQSIPEIIEGPFYKGITTLGTSSVDLLFFAKCNEEDIYTVQRGMNRELKILFDKNNIAIPFPQVVVNQPKEKTVVITDEQEIQAREFFNQQKQASKPIDQAQVPEHDEDII